MEESSHLICVDTKAWSVGLLCHYLFSDGSAQYTFLNVDNDRCIVDHSLGFYCMRNVHICASCNGLLLLSCVAANQRYYHVCSTVTKQPVTLPEIHSNRRIIRSGLAYDGQHFQVVLVFYNEGEEASEELSGLEMEIFSSETGEWMRHHPLILSPSPIPTELPRLNTPPLFSNGAIHWELGAHLLVYHVADGYCKLIKLPDSERSLTFGQCLWESEGRVHYCFSDFEGIHIWVLIHEFKWHLAHSVMHQFLKLQQPEIFPRLGEKNEYFSEWEPHFVLPCAFVENSQILYLRLPGIVISYNLRTQTVKEVCSSTFPNTNFYCCSFYPFLTFQMENVGSMVGKGEIVNLPIQNAQNAVSCKNNCNSEAQAHAIQ